MLCDDNTIISGSFKIQGAQKNLSGSMWLAIYNDAPRPIRIARSSKKFFADKKRFLVSINNNSFYERRGKYYLHIDEGRVNLKIVAEPLITWQDNTLHVELEEGSTISWIVPVLRGKFKGELTVGKKKKKITGIFFHDHVRDNLQKNLSLARNFKGWIWGVMYRKEETILYVRVDHKTKPFTFICHEKKGKVKTKKGKVLVRKDHHVIKINMNNTTYLSSLDTVHKVDYYEGNNLVMKFLVNNSGIRKYHAYNSKTKEYMECVRMPKIL